MKLNNQIDPLWLIDVGKEDKGVGVFAISDVESPKFGAVKIV